MKSEGVHLNIHRDGYEIMKEWGIDFMTLPSMKIFDDDKIRIMFTRAEYYCLEAYLKDNDKNFHEVLYMDVPDRHHISFDKTNQKVKNFIKSVVNSWVEEETKEEMERRLLKEKEKKRRKSFYKIL